jgi:hypothetical protein
MTSLVNRFLRSRSERIGWCLVALLIGWLIVSYWLVPDWWKHRESRHQELINGPRLTHTGQGIPGDPVNLSIVGSEEDLKEGLLKEGWYPADPITLKSSLRIIESTLFHRSYQDAPVSKLFLFGRMEDLAFEKPVGNDPRERHHVRFWRADAEDPLATQGWLGAVTFDRSVGFSHTTGQITHHIAPDIDLERDGLIRDLQRAGKVRSLAWKDDFQNPREGRNGGGDRWVTDGRLPVVTLSDKNPVPPD